MEQAQPRPFRPSLSVRQMMKLVVFGAVASACMAPAFHLVEIGVSTWPAFLTLEGVAVPLVLALTAFPLVRKGPLKDWLIRASLGVSVAVALGFAIYFLIYMLIVISGGWPTRWIPQEIGFLAIDTLVIIVLALAFALLARGISPRRCPDCARLTLILDAKADVSPEDGPGKSYLCLCCRGHFHRPNGPLNAVRHGHG